MCFGSCPVLAEKVARLAHEAASYLSTHPTDISRRTAALTGIKEEDEFDRNFPLDMCSVTEACGGHSMDPLCGKLASILRAPLARARYNAVAAVQLILFLQVVIAVFVLCNL